MTARGIDHIGVTVPDIEAATRFFVTTLGARVLYDALPRSAGPRSGPDLDRRLGVPSGTVQVAIRLLGLPDGPGIELFEYTGPRQLDAALPNDYGWQHLAIYVDDIDAVVNAVWDAGGTVLSAPRSLAGPESGPGNRFVYCRTPWGSTLELITFPGPQLYESLTPDRRWRPAPVAALALALAG